VLPSASVRLPRGTLHDSVLVADSFPFRLSNYPGQKKA
jgi:hypothetical protein